MKPTSIDNIVAKFPTKILPPIPGEPDYDCISQLDKIMYGNAATLPTTLGGGAHGHVGLIMKATLYVTLAATAYVTPNEPPLTPDVPSTATSASQQHSEINMRKNTEYSPITSTWTTHSKPNFWMQLKIRM